MVETVRLLYVDDDSTSLRFRASLLNKFDTLEVSTANGVRNGLAQLDTIDFDCVLSDLNMPGRDGMDFLCAVREHRPELPFILFTTSQPKGTIKAALDADVTDYVVKDDREGFHQVLVNRIEQFVEHHRTKKRLQDIENTGVSPTRHPPDATEYYR